MTEAPTPARQPERGWRWRSSRLALAGVAAAVVATTVLVQPTGAPDAFANDTELGPVDTPATIRVVVQAKQGEDPIPSVEAAGATVRRSFPARRAVIADVNRDAWMALRADERLSIVKPLRQIVRTDPRAALDHSQWRQTSTDPTVQPISLAKVAEASRTSAMVTAGHDGDGIDVALIDTGVAPVPGLDTADAVVNGPDLSFDYQGGAPAGYDAYGHGTHLASIIASRDPQIRGIAPKSRILNMKVGAYDGAVDVTQVIAAIDWVVQNRTANGLNVRVLNLAFGVDALQSYQVDPLSHAVESAWRNGIVVVVSAGNSGAAMMNPAINPFVIAVGAADLAAPETSGDEKVAEFSSVGGTARGVDILAPGVSIVGARNPDSFIDQAYPTAREGERGFRGSGTSQAAAVVSGAVATMLEARPSLTPDQVKKRLRDHADFLPGSQTGQGRGLIDTRQSTEARVVSATAQNSPASTGTGSLDLARGGYFVEAPDGVALRGEQDIFGQAWNPAVWAPASRAGTAWTGGIWNNNVWTGSAWAVSGDPETAVWVGRTWRSAQWVGRTWRGSSWDDAVWDGRTWRQVAWDGRTWREAAWDGRTWRDAGWEGRTWRDFGWDGRTWRGSSWSTGS